MRSSKLAVGVGVVPVVVLLALSGPSALAATRVLDFEGPTYGTADDACVNAPIPPMFNRPGYSGSTSAFILTPTACGEGTFGGGNGNDSLLTAQILGTRSNELRFSWVDPNDNNTWLRAVTVGTVRYQNPTVHLGVGSKISMKVLVACYDATETENTAGQVEFSLMIQETGTTASLGEYAGASGQLEMLGVDAVSGSTLTPSGGAVVGHGTAWTTITWKILSTTEVELTVGANAPVTKTIQALGTFGDGILSAPNNRGGLNSLCIRKGTADTVTKKLYINVDDIVIEAPGISDPPVIQTPVVSDMTEVTVNGVDPNATLVKLFKNAVEVASAAPPFNPGGGSHKFVGLTLAAGDVLTATQVVDGIESAASVAVTVKDALLPVADNFDGYADQAALNAIWPRTSTQPDFNITLSTLKVASCPKSVLEPAASSGSPSRIYQNLGGNFDGTDAKPLTVTAWMYHGQNGENGRNYIELRSYSGGGYLQGTLNQLLALGIYDDTSTGITRTVYNGRVALGTPAINWFDVTGATRTPDAWVKLQIKVKSSTIDFTVVTPNGTYTVTKTRNNPSALFNTIVIGSGLSNGGVYAYYDNLSISLGEPPTEPFGPPATTPVPGSLVAPVEPGDTTVTVEGLDPSATEVKVYANDVLIGTASLSGETTKAVTVSPVPCGLVAATQVIAGVESCYSPPANALYTAPVIQTPLLAGACTVTLTGLDVRASEVKVYSGDVLLGSAAVSGETTKAVPVTPHLTGGQAVQASQVINGYECIRSAVQTVATQTIIKQWTQTSSLPQGLTDHVVIYYNGYVYSFGGRRDSSVTADTRGNNYAYYAAVNGDGSIGPWTATTVLPARRAIGAAYGYNGRIYYWGGWDETFTTRNTCWYTTQNSDGSLGSWTVSSVTIPPSASADQMDSFGRGVLGLGDTLFIVNGEDNNGTLTKKCYYSKIQPDGDYGPWVETSQTANAAWFHGVLAFAGTSESYLYWVGGNFGGTNQREVYRATINADGSLGAWAEAGLPNLPAGRYEHGVALAGNTAIVLGGLGGSGNTTAYNTVYFTKIDPATGGMGTWFAGASYPISVGRNCAVAYPVGDKWYVLGVGGGPYSGGPRSAACYYTLIDTDGDADSYGDTSDNCPLLPNTDQTDGDCDGVGDACDACPNSPPGSSVGPDGCSPCSTPPADVDGDTDVDLTDFGAFQACFNGPNRPWPGPPVDQQKCACLDADVDGDVDLTDFGQFQTCFNGPNRPAACP